MVVGTKEELLDPVLLVGGGQCLMREPLKDLIGQLLLAFEQLVVDLCHEFRQTLGVILESGGNAKFAPRISLLVHGVKFDDFARWGLAFVCTNRTLPSPCESAFCLTIRPRSVINRGIRF